MQRGISQNVPNITEKILAVGNCCWREDHSVLGNDIVRSKSHMCVHMGRTNKWVIKKRKKKIKREKRKEGRMKEERKAAKEERKRMRREKERKNNQRNKQNKDKTKQ